MRPPLRRAAAVFTLLGLTSLVAAQAPLPVLPPPRPAENLEQPAPSEPGLQVLDRGPIHEAFAQPGADVRGKGMTAPKAPPPPVPELPPDTKPDGTNVKWIPGYWAWDDEKQDFIWISGFYRDVPPDRDWQPGQWREVGGKWTYLPGWWRPVTMNRWRIDLPEPPRSLERGPSTPPDDPKAVWIPGVWEFRNEQYLWRPGYWAVPNGNLIWQPPQYITTGSGFCYVPGYWDYPLEERGLLFAPVCFTQPLWQTPGWWFRPRFALNIGIGWGGGWGWGGFFNSLFIGPGWNSFCFGNYFPPTWCGGPWLGFGHPMWCSAFSLGTAWCGWGGYRPWCWPNPGFCNPLWNNYCWLNRTNPNWAVTVQRTYVAQSLGTLPRPVTVANRTAAPAVRPLAITPQGLGGAAQTAVRSAVATAKPTPFIQPAQEVARSLQANRVAATTGRPNPAGASARPAANQPATAAVRPAPAQQVPPVHAASAGSRPATGRVPNANSLMITPDGQATSRPTTSAGSSNPPRPTDRGPLAETLGRPNPAAPPTRPDSSTTLLRPERNPTPANLGLPRDLTPSRPSPPSNPVLPGTSPVRPSTSAIPARPTAPLTPTIRPSTPAIRPSTSIPPAIRPGPINPVGGGSVRPSGGSAIGRPPVRR